MRRMLNQGDIVLLSLDPTLGTEIKGGWPALVLSNAETNRQGRALVAPITQGASLERVRGWTITLMGSGTVTQGVVIINQARFVDFAARGAKYIESAPQAVMDEALSRLQAALD